MEMTKIIKRLYRQSVFVLLIPFAIVSAVIEWKRLPLCILIGGILALANLQGACMGYRRTGRLAAEQVSGKLVFLSLIRLFILFRNSDYTHVV